ncbi:MAG: hypothetical protein AB7G68_12475 [Nitrospiraceae bacterium]
MPPACCERCHEAPPLGETLHHRDGWLCANCLAKEVPGKDLTSKRVHFAQAAQFNRTLAMSSQAAGNDLAAQDYERQADWHADAAALLNTAGNNRARGAQIALGEIVPEEPGLLKDTLSLPDLTAMDASLERTRLLMASGVDTLALGLDAANTAGAASSLEKMHLHQLAVLHKTALEHIASANYITDLNLQAQHLQTANRLIRTFQQGLIALVGLRGGGMPIIQHVHINDGAQAVVGTVQKDIPTGRGRDAHDV